MRHLISIAFLSTLFLLLSEAHAQPARGIGAVYAHEDHAYVLDKDSTLSVFDVSTPGDPVLVSRTSIPCPDGFRCSTGDLVVRGSIAYLALYPYLRVYDISDPFCPRFLTAGDVEIYGGDRIVARGDYAYLASAVDPAFRVVDVSDPARPVTISGYDNRSGDRAVDVALAGDTAYVPFEDYFGEDASYRFWALDISDPTEPGELSSFKPRAGLHGAVVEGQGRFAYLALPDSLHVLEMSSPDGMAMVSSRSFDGDESTSYPMDMQLLPEGLLVLLDMKRLRVFHLSSPAHPSPLGQTEVEAARMHVAGGIAYLTTGEGGLKVVDLSNPAHPRVIGSYATASEPVQERDGTAVLQPPAPNPFREATRIQYVLRQPARVRLVVYDVLGRQIRVLADRRHQAGTHRARLESRRLATGTYFILLEVDGEPICTRATTLIR